MKFLSTLVAICVFASVASAILVTPGGTSGALATALTKPGTGLTITSLSISGHGTAGSETWGTFTNASGTYSIGPGIVISTGKVADYSDGPNTTGSNSTGYTGATVAPILAGISPGPYFDITQIDITFDLAPGFDTVYFNVAFGSEEYDEYVGSQYIDAFGMFVNGTNVAFVGGLPVNVDNPAMAFVAGTELDGMLAPGGVPVVTFSQFVGAGGTTGNTLTFIIADTGDSVLDSTAYIAALGGTPTPVPESGGAILLLATVLGTLGVGYRRRRQVT